MKTTDIKVVSLNTVCPEQYEFYNSKTEEKIGYLRVRFGVLRCDYYDGDGRRKVILTLTFPFDDYRGYLNETERRYYLPKVRKLLVKEYNKEHGFIQKCKKYISKLFKK